MRASDERAMNRQSSSGYRTLFLSHPSEPVVIHVRQRLGEPVLRPTEGSWQDGCAVALGGIDLQLCDKQRV